MGKKDYGPNKVLHKLLITIHVSREIFSGVKEVVFFSPELVENCPLGHKIGNEVRPALLICILQQNGSYLEHLAVHLDQ